MPPFLTTGTQTFGQLLKVLETSIDSNAFSALCLSIATTPLIDDRGITWMRRLMKAKSLHSTIEALLIVMRDQSETLKVDGTEAGMLLIHQCDLVNQLSAIKKSPLRFDVDAPLPS